MDDYTIGQRPIWKNAGWLYLARNFATIMILIMIELKRGKA